MDLELYDKDSKLICKLDNDDKTLESYDVQDGMRIHVSCVSFKSFFYSFAFQKLCIHQVMVVYQVSKKNARHLKGYCFKSI